MCSLPREAQKAEACMFGLKCAQIATACTNILLLTIILGGGGGGGGGESWDVWGRSFPIEPCQPPYTKIVHTLLSNGYRPL